jgi:hypothetical protein
MLRRGSQREVAPPDCVTESDGGTDVSALAKDIGGRIREDDAASSRVTAKLPHWLRFADTPHDWRAALLRYWADLAMAPSDTRLRRLQAIEFDDWLDRTALRGIALHALADHEDEVVFESTRRYLIAACSHGIDRSEAIPNAMEWVRRGLALRPHAVFAALLDRRDESINERLKCLRPMSSSHSVREILARLGTRDDRIHDEFLDEWRALETTEISRRQSQL